MDEENHVPNPDDGDISDNVEDVQRELIAERIKNRDLNQTISDILKRMAEMEMDIFRNEEKITQAQSSVVLLSKDVEENSALITNVIDDVVSLTSSDQQQTVQIESLSSQIDLLGAMGHWCAARFNSWGAVGTIPYDTITFSDSNLNITGTPLDISTGINSHKCYY